MSDRRGASRTMGPTKQCAVIERGDRRCFGCRRKLRAPRALGTGGDCSATIDHYDGDWRNHDPANLLPACNGCNTARRWPDAWEAQLKRHRETPERAAERARQQLATPLDLAAGRELAWAWGGDRFERCKIYDQTYRLRRAGLLPPVTDFP